MLEQMQTKDSKAIWKLQYKGSLLVEYAIILGLAAIFLVFNGFFDPIGDKAEKNAKAVNKDAYVYGGVPKGSVTQTPDGTTAPPHSSNGQIITGTSSGSGSPGDNSQPNIQFASNGKDEIWSTNVKDKIGAPKGQGQGVIKYFSTNELLSFDSEAKGKYRIFFNTDATKKTTNIENDKVYLPVYKNDNNHNKGKIDFGSLQIQVITYKYDNQKKLIIEVLRPSGIDQADIDQDGYFPIGDVELSIVEPCYVAFNFRGDNSEITGMKGGDRMERFIHDYMKIVKI